MNKYRVVLEIELDDEDSLCELGSPYNWDWNGLIGSEGDTEIRVISSEEK